MSARQDLAAALEAQLPPTAKVVTDFSSLGELDPKITAVAQFVRVSTKPAPTNGRYILEFEGWIITPSKDPAVAEDALDEGLDTVIEAIEAIPNLLWTEAVRAVHADGYHGHKLTLTITGTTKE